MSQTTTHRFRVGLTGGIACGKSAAERCFHARGIQVFDADQLARQLCLPGAAGWEDIVEQFGHDYLRADQQLDREKLRRRIFTDPDAKRVLEKILHPRVYTLLDDLSRTATSPYVVWSVPLLLETDAQHRVDRVLVVDCTPETQQARGLGRGGWDIEQVQAAIAQQWSREKRIAAADDILDNNSDLLELDRRVGMLHAQYLQRAQRFVPRNTFRNNDPPDAK